MKRKILINTRRSKNLTIKDLAQKVGINEQYMWQIEKGIRTPSLQCACKIEKVLKVPVCELFEMEEEDDE